VKPVFKYSGGKTRELKRIRALIEDNNITFNRVVEPFVGGGAFAFDQEKPAVISDVRANNIDVYRAIQDETQFKLLSQAVDALKGITDKKKLESTFYYWRDDKYQNCSALWEKAMRWIVLRQLCFSGMDRVNKKTGKFNVPYGWYDTFTTRLSVEHHRLLQTWEIHERSFEESIAASTETDFIFVDPPYLDRNSDYGSQDHSLAMHQQLCASLHATPATWLLIHTRHPFYEEQYKRFTIVPKAFRYASQWKGRTQTDRHVEHLYITNHPNLTTSLFMESR
jgi:DNA adenine methylase